MCYPLHHGKNLLWGYGMTKWTKTTPTLQWRGWRRPNSVHGRQIAWWGNQSHPSIPPGTTRAPNSFLGRQQSCSSNTRAGPPTWQLRSPATLPRSSTVRPCPLPPRPRRYTLGFDANDDPPQRPTPPRTPARPPSPRRLPPATTTAMTPKTRPTGPPPTELVRPPPPRRRRRESPGRRRTPPAKQTRPAS